MNTMITFIKKEFIEQVRSRRLLILVLLFVFFGVLNPMTAMLTPYLLELMSESLEGSGIIIDEVKVSAFDSWIQFFKNLPLALVAFILLQSSIFSKEYRSGALTLVLTKGFERYKVVVAKLISLLLLWTILFYLNFGITYGYTIYLWDNSITNNLFFSAFIWWLFGVFVIAIFTIVSTIFISSSMSLVLCGGIAFGIYLIGLVPKLTKYFPTLLLDGMSLVSSLKEVNYYLPSILITITLIISCIVGSIFIFNKKKL